MVNKKVWINGKEKLVPESLTIFNKKEINRKFISHFKDLPVIIEGRELAKILFIDNKGQMSIEHLDSISENDKAMALDYIKTVLYKFYLEAKELQDKFVSSIKHHIKERPVIEFRKQKEKNDKLRNLLNRMNKEEPNADIRKAILEHINCNN